VSGLKSSGRHEGLKSNPAMELLDISEQSDGSAKSVGNGPTNDVIDMMGYRMPKNRSFPGSSSECWRMWLQNIEKMIEKFGRRSVTGQTLDFVDTLVLALTIDDWHSRPDQNSWYSLRSRNRFWLLMKSGGLQRSIGANGRNPCISNSPGTTETRILAPFKPLNP
jgi:hypothetical protein